ncbi:superoxide dismutase, partial [Gigaspora rosea]
LLQTEYAVDMTCDSCVESIRKVLTKLPALPSFVSKQLKETGKTVIVRGQGNVNGNIFSSHSGAAVCIFEDHTYTPLNSEKPLRKPQGLCRLIQIDKDYCLIDVTVQGIPPGRHGIHIHELGDISAGPSSTGAHYNPDNVEHGDIESGHIGDLGNIHVDKNGWGDLVVESRRIKVWDVIGRSMVITHGEDDEGKGSNAQSKIDGNSGPGLIAGIIARSAGIFENKKKVCACSGKTLWEEARI